MTTLLKRQQRAATAKTYIFCYAMLFLPILQFLIFYVYVNIDSVLMSFRYLDNDYNLVWGFQNYQKFFQDLFMGGSGEIWSAVAFSLMVGVNDVVLVLISTILAFFLFEKMPLEKFFRVVFFLPSIISIVVYVTAYKSMFQDNVGIVPAFLNAIGLESPYWFNDKVWSKILILGYCLWVGTGYNILILGGAMANISKEVLESMRMEGVGLWRRLFHFVIPMIWPTLTVSFLGSAGVVFTFFIQVQLIMGGEMGLLNSTGTQTIALMINLLAQNENTKNWASTIGVCFSIVAAPCLLGIKKLLDTIGRKWGYVS